ncbi:MAG TPA: glycosyltransferase family 4 protein [Gemmatimonadaceae bacterium]|nr:glycosyltransferase family 4 protein [Gemmatimonadaceae bacterium]
MTSLRFCLVTTFYPPRSFGGDAVAVQSLARALVRRGHHVSVVCDDDAYRTLSGHDDHAPPELDDGVVVHRLASRLGAVAVGLTQQTGHPVVHGGTLRRILDQGRFDVIHYHNLSLVGGPGALAIGRGLKLYTAHEHWLVCPTHVLWRHRVEPCPSRECLRCQLTYGRPPQLWRHTGLLAGALDHVDAFIALSRFSRDKHREFGFPRDMEVIPGFMRDPGPPVASAPTGERPYFLVVGRLESLKGLDDVIDAFATDVGAELVIVGEGSERAALEARAAGNPRVRFVGFQAGDALVNLYLGAQAVIAASRGYETFGLSVIEAYSRGVPVLARRRGSFLELVEGSGAGETFADVAELQQLLRRLIAEPARQAAMGSAAYDRFRTLYSEEAVVPTYLALVSRLLPRAPVAPSMPRANTPVQHA